MQKIWNKVYEYGAKTDITRIILNFHQVDSCQKRGSGAPIYIQIILFFNFKSKKSPEIQKNSLPSSSNLLKYKVLAIWKCLLAN